MRAFSAASGECKWGAFIAPPDTTEENLLDGNLLALGGRLLRQLELEHAVAELRLGARLVDLLRQREAAADLAEGTLAVQHAFVLGGFFFALHLGAEGDLGAVDRHLDVLL